MPPPLPTEPSPSLAPPTQQKLQGKRRKQIEEEDRFKTRYIIGVDRLSPISISLPKV
jgi:hypothetical protein